MTTWGGVRVDPRTSLMLDEADRLTTATMRPTQGSYSTSVGASAGTHSGGGAVDFSTRGLNATEKLNLIRALRTVGFAAWIRPYRAGVWAEHIHAIAIQPGGRNDRGVLAPVAHRQVQSYYDGRDGLASNSPDPHASLGIRPRTFEQYRRARSFPLPEGHSFGTPKSRTVHDGTANPEDAKNVQRIQQRLRIQPTGRFGTYTRVKVANWQLWKGIRPTGRVGAETWRRLGL
jgi:hypothetical protein